MDRRVTREVPEASMSTIALDMIDADDEYGEDIEEIVRSSFPVRKSGETAPSHPYSVRQQRDVARRRKRPEEFQYGASIPKIEPYNYPIADDSRRRSVEGSVSSNSSAASLPSSATSPYTDIWSSSGSVQPNSHGLHFEEDDAYWEHDDTLLLPKLEQEDEAFDMASIGEESLLVSPSHMSTHLTGKRPRGRPRKFPRPVRDPNAKAAKGRSKTGCYTCRRRKKKCDERKPHCKLLLLLFLCLLINPDR
jgi:hypothetical protein